LRASPRRSSRHAPRANDPARHGPRRGRESTDRRRGALDLDERLAAAAEAGRVDLGDLGRRAHRLLASTTSSVENMADQARSRHQVAQYRGNSALHVLAPGPYRCGQSRAAGVRGAPSRSCPNATSSATTDVRSDTRQDRRRDPHAPARDRPLDDIVEDLGEMPFCVRRIGVDRIIRRVVRGGARLGGCRAGGCPLELCPSVRRVAMRRSLVWITLSSMVSPSISR
jgi:hypothetical protein